MFLRLDGHVHVWAQVQAALMDVSKSPWKIIKYTFNKKVMSALKVRDQDSPTLMYSQLISMLVMH